MPAFDEKYSAEQRRAIEDGKLARGLTYKRISELAAAGELVKGEPFTIPPSYVGHLCRAAQRRRVGQIESGLATKPPRDAREALRRELVNLVAAEIAAEKRMRDGKRDPERLRQLARAVREIEQIKGATEPDPPRPGARDANGRAAGPRGTGGDAGALLKDHRRGGAQPEQDAHTQHADNGEQERPVQTDAPSTEHEHGQPGSLTSEQTQQLVA